MSQKTCGLVILLPESFDGISTFQRVNRLRIVRQQYRIKVAEFIIYLVGYQLMFFVQAKFLAQ